MKNVLLSLAVAALVLAGCGKKADVHGHDHTDGTHQHEDGAIHENHQNDAAKQEEFTVPKDTVTAEPHGHDHGEGADHQH